MGLWQSHCGGEVQAEAASAAGFQAKTRLSQEQNARDQADNIRRSESAAGPGYPSNDGHEREHSHHTC